MLGREPSHLVVGALVATLAACTHHHTIGTQKSPHDAGSSAAETGSGGAGLGGTGGSTGQPSAGGAAGGGAVLDGSLSAGGTTGLGGANADGGMGGARFGGGGATAGSGLGGSSPGGVGGISGISLGGSGVGAADGVGGLAAGGAVPAYGGAAGSSTVVSSSAPSDDRPAAPAWSAPFAESLGSPGWQQSSQPICNANQGSESIPDVWVDERGVFALVGADCDDWAGVPCGKDGASLRLNDGSGWQPYFQFPTGTFWTSGTTLWGGFPNGPLLVSGDFTQHSVAFVDKGSAEITGSDAALQSAFVVGNGVAYAVWDGLLEYSAGTWSTVATNGSSMLAVWADSQTLIACGGNQTILVKNGSGDLTQLAGVPAGMYTAVWAFAADDVWFGNSASQLLHYDGEKWKIYPTGSRDISFDGITQLWGSGGILYFATHAEFGRWNGTSVEMLLEPPADADMSAYPAQFGRFWGTSPTNVFVPVRDSRFAQYACGGIFVLWFDGTEFHRF